MARLYAVILAGGRGKRFWPASREQRPKQLLPIASVGEPLIAATLRRVQAAMAPDHVFIATAQHLLEATRVVLPELPDESFLAEPCARNTAACIGWATALVKRVDPKAVIGVFPSDHHVAEPEEFRVAVEQAVQVASRGVITTIGIRPTRPETGYGYLELGDELAAGGFQVRRFVEKPNHEQAVQYLTSGEHLWNSGMFFFRADVMLAAIKRHMPELALGLSRIDEAHRHGPDAERWEVRKTFESLQSVSIDYGVMEHVADLAVIPADCGWSDLGSWESVWELSERDANENVLPDNAIALDSRRNVVVDLREGPQEERVIALLGVEGLCVVRTEDALLVVPRDRAQEIKRIVELLRREKGGRWT